MACFGDGLAAERAADLAGAGASRGCRAGAVLAGERGVPGASGERARGRAAGDGARLQDAGGTPLVSRACRPVGPAMTVTTAAGDVRHAFTASLLAFPA